MGSGPHSPLNWGATAREGFGSPQWSDNVARMHAFMQDHPEVEVTTPIVNGTGEFLAVWPGGRVSDASLGWLMDRLEQHFRGVLPE